MAIGVLLAVAGGVLTALLGLLGVLRPHAAAAMVGVEPLGARGLAEVRATYGGLFLALGLVTLWLHTPEGWLVAGVAWGGAAVARALSMLMDRDFGRLNVGGVLLEGGVASLFLAYLFVPLRVSAGQLRAFSGSTSLPSGRATAP